MTGFKNFILRGNLVELAVAVIMGTSFAAVVTAFTGMLLSLVSRITGGTEPNFDAFAPGDVLIGPFLTALIAFLILAAVIYFFVVMPYTRAKDKFFPAEESGTPADVALLEEIRDLLKARGGAV
ncbi:MscL family protein [Nocardioides hwasunensis]|uniref:MscL family protein n=1 Tax=Nocardioides hwasunensis TaxID=397258 RepID=A0ABR8MLQ4_9ACTN|nr:MscL family protein [Nocardioides hwasunensis]MBD3916946.1 MscL family protein [Nocardioides hwasunensis]